MSTAFHNPNLAELSIVVIVFSASSFKVQQHRRMRAARSPAVKDTVQTVDCIGAGSKSSQGPDLQEQQLCKPHSLPCGNKNTARLNLRTSKLT
jgi:hypothetical protein